MNPQGVNKVLFHFGSKTLKHSDEFYDIGIESVQKVFLKLQKEMSKQKAFTVAKHFVAGSFGKRTDVIEPDMDLVVVVNNCKPEDYSKVLDLFEQILELNQEELGIQKDSIQRKTQFSIQFNFKNGIEVDLLPAANLTTEEVYSEISRNPDKYYSYSSCLVQQQMGFMKSQDSFTHALIRLLKYWYKSLHLGDVKFFGAGLIMELIGVAAAEMEPEDQNVLRALNNALEMISKLDSIKLVFSEDSKTGKWKRIPEKNITMTLVQNQTVGIRDILLRKRFIVEPANPWNDLLNDKEDEVLEKLKKYATVTKNRLGLLVGGHQDFVKFDGQSYLIDLFKLFEPQPLSLKREFPSGYPKETQVSYSCQSKSPLCDMKVRREEPLQKVEVKMFVEGMKWNLLARVKSIVPTSTEDMRKAVKGMVETTMETTLGPAPVDRHDQMDVTITVPYYVGSDLYAVKLSFEWK